MKKKLTLSLVLVFVLLSMLILASCMKTIEFSINFISDGEIVHTIQTSGEEAIQMPPAPTKQGYVFSGWYWDEGIWQEPFTASSLLNTALSSDMNVFAKWVSEEVTTSSYTVEFNSMGGSAVESQAVLYGNLATEPSTPTRDGYIFVGWYKEADFAEKWSFTADTVSKNTTLYAKWVSSSDANGCNILSLNGFEQNGKIFSASVENGQQTIEISNIIQVSPQATYIVSTDIEGKNTIPSGTVTLSVGSNTFYILVTSGSGSNKSQYTIKVERAKPPMATITLDVNGGRALAQSELEIEIGQPIDKLPKPARVGYTFEGWYDKNDQTKQITTETIANNDMELIAIWKEYEGEPESILSKYFNIPTLDNEDAFWGRANVANLINGNLEETNTESVVLRSGNTGRITLTSKNNENVYISQLQVVGNGVGCFVVSIKDAQGNKKEVGIANINSNRIFDINEEVSEIEIYLPFGTDTDYYYEILGYEVPIAETTPDESIAYESFKTPVFEGSGWGTAHALNLYDGYVGTSTQGTVSPKNEEFSIILNSKEETGVLVNEIKVEASGSTVSFELIVTYAGGETESLGIKSFGNSIEIGATVTSIELHWQNGGIAMYISEITIK